MLWQKTTNFTESLCSSVNNNTFLSKTTFHLGKLVGENCDGNLNKCLSPFALCRDGVCRCNMLMEPTTDGLCRAPFEAEIHQSCEEKFCVSSTVCVNDVCECPDDMREITSDEYWFDPCKARRCVNANHSLGKCSSYYIQCTVY